ncbi:MAG: DUF971 domain-containing protein [Ignavibacteria bacterium]|nr:DUF971 domain-containing protein [Ignavibacteria bacterium]
MIPVKLNIDKNTLNITWNDNSEDKIKLANLRRLCPCAVCNSEREKNGNTYIPIYTGNQLKIENIKIVGSYAVNIIWKDGHSNGIYDFDYLLKISRN